MLETGIKGEQILTVDRTNTADAYGSGELPVFATPAMIALMEYTASQSVAEKLADGQSTVGTRVDVRHVAATPVGMQVTCVSELAEIDRNRLVFRVKALDACGVIGEGIHERFIIEKEKFLQKTNGKKES
ncbi:MAG: thioesterase family protein [Clostridia bacterium]